MYPEEEKAALRGLCLARRRALAAEQRAAFSTDICRRLLALPEVAKAGTLLSYLAAGEEADLRALHLSLIAAGKRLAFPVVTGPGWMEAYAPTDEGAIEPGAFGIRAPRPERAALVPPKEIDLVLVPCLGFDRALHRLGHGGGYYDRYLLRCPQAVRVAVALSCQELAEVPWEPHDLAMHLIVTEQEIMKSDR